MLEISDMSLEIGIIEKQNSVNNDQKISWPCRAGIPEDLVKV